MSEHPLQSFIELVSFDQATYALEDSVQQLEKEIELLEKTSEDLSSGSTLLVHRMKDARKEVEQVELNMKTLDQQEIEEKKRLEKVANQKEYQLIMREIDTLKRQQHDYENTLLVSWNKLEAFKKEYEVRHAQDENKTAELKLAIEHKQESVSKMHDELDGRLRQRDEMKRGIPAEWLEKYVLMRSRVTNPVVQVINGSCMGCFYNLPPQEFLVLKRKQMIQCKCCFRFLYIAPSKE